MQRKLWFITIFSFLSLIISTRATYAADNYLSIVNGASLLNISGDNGVTAYGSTQGSCTEGDVGTWDWIHALCDRNGSISARNSTTIASAPSVNAGSTWNNNINGYGYLDVDLGQSRTFNQLVVFQMGDSDGKITHIQLYGADSYPGEWTSIFNETAVSDVIGSVVNGGPEYQMNNPTTINFSTTTSRYVRLKVKNDGTHGSSGYIEVFSIKLFNSGSSGYTIINNPANTNITLASNWTTDTTTDSQTGIKSVGVTTDTNYRVATFNVDFSANRDFSAVSTDSDGSKSFFHVPGGFTALPGASGTTFTLYVPDLGGTRVIICPGADSFADVFEGCSNMQVKTLSDNNVSKVSEGGRNYWKISGLSSTGGQDGGGAVGSAPNFSSLTIAFLIISTVLLTKKLSHPPNCKPCKQ